MPKYDFRCESDHVFEGVSLFDDEIKAVRPLECPVEIEVLGQTVACGEHAERIWIRPPTFHGDENLSREERVSVLMHTGQYVTTRSRMREYERVAGDAPLTKAEVEQAQKAETEAQMSKDERIRDKKEFIEWARIQRKQGSLPPVGARAEKEDLRDTQNAKESALKEISNV